MAIRASTRWACANCGSGSGMRLGRAPRSGAVRAGWGCDVRGAERRACRPEVGVPGRTRCTAPWRSAFRGPLGPRCRPEAGAPSWLHRGSVVAAAGSSRGRLIRGGCSAGLGSVRSMKLQAGYPREISPVPGGKQHGARQRGRSDQGVGKADSRLPANLPRPLGDLPVDGDFAQRSQQGGRFPDSARSGEQLRSRYDRVVQSMAVRPQRAGASQVVDEHVRVHQNVSHVPIRRGWGRPRPAPRRT